MDRVRRMTLVACILGSGIAFLDSTVVNVALPAIRRDLGTGLSAQQWIVEAYLLTLGAMLLVGGSLGDTLGRRRIFRIGVAGFGVTSALCAVAPTAGVLVGARALQGVAGALLVPSSLAIITAVFGPSERGRAIGTWTAWTGVAMVAGPLGGGLLVDAVSWRLIFAINLPLVVVNLFLLRHVPESVDEQAGHRVDVEGAILCALGLAGPVFALTEQPNLGWGSAQVIGPLVAGLVLFGAFLAHERRAEHPMLPLEIFRSRQFSAANAVTFVVYAALGGFFFLLVAFLQISLGYSPIAAGAASLPVTLLMLLFSARAGALAQRIGPRLPLTVGPLIVAVGLLMLTQLDEGSNYLTGILPGIVVFGIGLTLVVAPVTATVLAAADSRHSGIASGVNNAVARAAGLLAVATLPLTAGITGADYRSPAAFSAGFRLAMFQCAGLLALAGVLAWLTVRARGADCPEPERRHTCPLDAPALAHAGRSR
jgi:EmrB/QacA subfamily drug resistance transporter